MGTYTQMQFADSMGKGGEAGAAAQMAQSMMGMGMGMAMAGQMAGGFGQQQPQMQQPMQGQPYQQPYGQPMQQPMGGAQVPPPMPGAMPPPIPGAMPALAVHVALNGAQQGPFDFAQLQQLVQAGQLTPATMVWMAGLQQWTPASGVPALAVLFQPTPPPMN